MRYAMLLVLLTASVPVPTQAARRVTADKAVTAILAPYYPVTITYPESIVRVVGAAAARQGPQADDGSAPLVGQVSTEFHGAAVYLFLLAEGAEGRVVAVGESGAQYSINYKHGTPGDDQIEVVRPTPTQQKTQPFTMASFMRMLRFPDQVAALQREHTSGQIEVALPTIPDPGIAIVASTAVMRGPGVGMILHLANNRATPVTIDVRVGEPHPAQEHVVALSRWGWPSGGMEVRMVSAKRETLLPGEQTELYAVFERRGN